MADWRDKGLIGIPWAASFANHEAKRRIATKLAARVRDGDIVGVGSGSTCYLTIVEIARRVGDENIRCKLVPTSHETEHACFALGLSTASLVECRPDWLFDGADEIDPAGNLLKGRGGALYREKLAFAVCPRRVIAADQSKFVPKLGTRFPVPVECERSSIRFVAQEVRKLGATEIALRQGGGKKDGPVITENGNFLLDCRFAAISPELEKELKTITGVFESRIF
jgi:ribose 5-phosphate isomerase A